MDKKGLSDAVSPVGKLDFSKIYDSCNNYAKGEMPKLKNMYDQQVKINSESKEELEKSRWYNRWMMVSMKGDTRMEEKLYQF